MTAAREVLERARGWPLALAVTALAALLRLPHLDRPGVLVFDETYYVKDAWTLLHLGYEGRWPEDPDPAFESGAVDGYSTTASYVVHPPAGKWLIAIGLRLLGAQDPVGWRLSSAVAGVLLVLLVARIGRRLLRSTALGGLAGLVVAVDGVAIAHSRTALLDGFLALGVLAAFGALLLDRDAARRRLARLTAPPRTPAPWGPAFGVRPWRIAAGVLLGLALGVKWSALWFVAAFGLLTVAWDASARWRAGIPRWWQAAVLRDGPLAALALLPTALLTYLATWSGWFATSGGYHRQWAATHPGEGLTWLPEALRSLGQYHRDMWAFHTTVTSEHPYAAHPVGWLLQWRPTAFFYTSPEPARQVCDADQCSQTVTSLGNPLVWWLGTAAVLACAWWLLRRRDGVAGAALAGVAAGWLPWLAFSHRTVFTFYVVVLLPWLALCLAWAAGRWWRSSGPLGRGALVGVVVVVLAVSWFFLPVWTGEVLTFGQWQRRQWLPSWV